MKKKRLGIAVAVLAGILLLWVSVFSSASQADTAERREQILREAISTGSDWTIVKETELDGYLISGAYSTDNQSALAIFEPVGNGNYKLMTATNQNREEILIDRARIRDKWYDFIWFDGAETEYAEITYTIGESESDTRRYDTRDMEILCCESPETEYTLQVVYYDRDGNPYQ